MEIKTVSKGSRIRAQWWACRPVPLAGVMLKFEGTPMEVVGTVRHHRVDDPVNPTVHRFYVDQEGTWEGPTVRPPGCTCANPHVEVDPKHVIEVLE